MSDEKEDEYLGWRNDWKYPDDGRYKRIKACDEAGHKRTCYSDGRGYNKERCETCGYYYECDSSG